MEDKVTLEKIATMAKAINDATPDAKNVTLTVTVGSAETLNKIDRELYVMSNGSDEGFVAGDEVSVTILGVDITIRV